MSEADAWKATKILLGCYRTGDANDPEIFATAIAAILSCYPPEVSLWVADPRTGLPGRSKWMPSPSEVREACEIRIAEINRAKRYDTWGQSRDEQIALPAPRKQNPTLEELKAAAGPNWGIRTDPLPNEIVRARNEKFDKPPMTADEIREHYRKYDLGFQPKRAAEDAA